MKTGLTANPSKLPGTGVTIFSVMSAMARACGAVNLSQGFPDFNPDEKLLHALEQAMRNNEHQYAMMQGNSSLRIKLAEKYAKINGVQLDPESEITITAGGTQAIFTAVQALVSSGDEVLLFAPCYDSYEPSVRLAGGVCVFYEMLAPDFAINWQEVRKLITKRTRMIIVNTPHNPTGVCFTEADMLELEKIVVENNLVVLSDEVYEHIVFDGRHHESVLRYSALRGRALMVSSFGKTYHCTGWKVGYCIAPSWLTEEFRKVHQYNVFSVNSIAQSALCAVMEHEYLYQSLSNFYERKRNYFRDLLAKTKFKILPCAGAYFQLADYAAISSLNEVAFAEWLTQKAGVASIPVSVFYPNGGREQNLIRFCFAKNDDTLQNAAEKLLKL